MKKKKVPADFIQSYIVAMKTHLRLFTKTNCVVGEPNSSMRTCRLRPHPVRPSSFQFKIARVRTLEVKQRPATELCRRETFFGPVLLRKQMEKPIHWRIYTRDQLCKFAVKFTLMARAISQHILPFALVDLS